MSNFILQKLKHYVDMYVAHAHPELEIFQISVKNCVSLGDIHGAECVADFDNDTIYQVLYDAKNKTVSVIEYKKVDEVLYQIVK